MKLLTIAVAALGLCASATAAQETTYTFTGGPYTSVDNAASCTVGECATYATSQRAIITLTFATPLAPNLPRGDRSPQVIAFTFTDGVRTTSGPSAIAALFDVELGTNSSGLPSDYVLRVQRTPGPPYPTSTPADPNSRFSFFTMIPSRASVLNNVVCGGRNGGSAAASGPGVCNTISFDPSTSQALSTSAPVVTSAATVPPAPIPTMTEWAMILLALLLASGAAVHLTRRGVV